MKGYLPIIKVILAGYETTGVAHADIITADMLFDCIVSSGSMLH